MNKKKVRNLVIIIALIVLAIFFFKAVMLDNKPQIMHGEIASCRLAANYCENGITIGMYTADATGKYLGCLDSCETGCTDWAGNDVFLQTAQNCDNPNSGCYMCAHGNLSGIKTA